MYERQIKAELRNVHKTPASNRELPLHKPHWSACFTPVGRIEQQQNGGDTLYNLTVSTVLGITDTTTQSILVRISDKIMRLVSLTKNPDTISEVKDESVQDTIEDTINYLVYLYCKYEEANKT